MTLSKIEKEEKRMSKRKDQFTGKGSRHCWRREGDESHSQYITSSFPIVKLRERHYGNTQYAFEITTRMITKNSAFIQSSTEQTTQCSSPSYHVQAVCSSDSSISRKLTNEHNITAKKMRQILANITSEANSAADNQHIRERHRVSSLIQGKYTELTHHSPCQTLNHTHTNDSLHLQRAKAKDS